MKKTRNRKLVLESEVVRSMVTELQRGRLQEVRGGATISASLCSDKCKTIDMTFP
jgi:hypothetical protein